MTTSWAKMSQNIVSSDSLNFVWHWTLYSPSQRLFKKNTWKEVIVEYDDIINTRKFQLILLCSPGGAALQFLLSGYRWIPG
jgi:hypothetical protein